MLTNRDAGNAYEVASLLNPAAWSASKGGIPLAGNIAEGKDKEYGKQGSYKSTDVHTEIPFRTLLKLHLGSESENHGVLSPSADIRVILNDRLEKKHRSNVQKRVEFKAVFRFPRWGTGRKELLTLAIPHVT